MMVFLLVSTRCSSVDCVGIPLRISSTSMVFQWTISIMRTYFQKSEDNDKKGNFINAPKHLQAFFFNTPGCALFSVRVRFLSVLALRLLSRSLSLPLSLTYSPSFPYLALALSLASSVLPSLGPVLTDALFPPWIIGRGSMTAWEARIVGEEWAREWSWWCAATRAPENPAQQYAAIPLEGWGPDTRPRPTVIRGAGPDHPWDAATGEWLQAAPGPQTGWTGDMSSLVRTPVPPRIVLHAANVLRATEIRKWGHATATIRWHPPEDGAAQLAVAHFKTGGHVYDDALSRLGDTQGPLLLMLPIDPAAALRQELNGCEGLRVGWEAVADGTLLALLHRDAANGCQWIRWRPTSPGATCTWQPSPRGTPARRGTTSSPPSTR